MMMNGSGAVTQRADWQAVRILFPSYLKQLGQVGQYASLLTISTAELCEKLQIKDPWLRSYFDLESFLLAGMSERSASFASASTNGPQRKWTWTHVLFRFAFTGVDSQSMIAAEFASVFGESDALGYAEFPVGSVEELANALVRGLEKHGGELRLKVTLALEREREKKKRGEQELPTLFWPLDF